MAGTFFEQWLVLVIIAATEEQLNAQTLTVCSRSQTLSPQAWIKREGWFKLDGGKSVKIGKVGAGGVLRNKNGYSKLEIDSHSTSLVQFFAEWLFNFGSLD